MTVFKNWKLAGVLAAGVLSVGTSWAQDAALQNESRLSWELATQVATEAVRACEAQGNHVTAVVVDTQGRQRVLIRGDQTADSSENLAFRKAYTIAAFGPVHQVTASSDLAKSMSNGVASLANVPNLIFVGGGILIHKSDKTPLGAIGISGSIGGDKDEACAQAGIDKYKSQFQ